MDATTTITEVIDRIEASRNEIATRYETRLKQHVRVYAPLSSAQLAATAAGMIGMFVRMLRARSAEGGGIDTRMLHELEVVSQERARQGIGVGDLYTAFSILQATGREVVFERTADSDLRTVSRAWVEIDIMTALVLSWILDEHGHRIEGAQK